MNVQYRLKGVNPAANDGAVRVVLVVDDSKMQRRILSASLSRAGYDVLEAASGEEALQICKTESPDLILSDWMMPGMTGPDFCRAFRELDRESYGYFILLTSKTEKNEIAHGLAVGADDFLTKPVNGDELRARIVAGERILRMERELTQKNRLMTDTLRELQGLYDLIDRDLVEARKLQQSLVREKFRSFGEADISLLLNPSGHVGGDLVGFFPIGERRVGIYAIDVSGHGITSALMTARIAAYFSAGAPDQNVALVQTGPGRYEGRAPAEVAGRLNRLVMRELQSDIYLTMAYADVDLISGHVGLVQAGHPHPAVLKANGDVEYVGAGGLPVGLFEDASYEGFELTLELGDRLLLMSDGIMEAENPDGEQLGETGMTGLIQRYTGIRATAFLDGLQRDLEEFTSGVVADDVSAVLLEFGCSDPSDV